MAFGWGVGATHRDVTAHIQTIGAVQELQHHDHSDCIRWSLRYLWSICCSLEWDDGLVVGQWQRRWGRHGDFVVEHWSINWFRGILIVISIVLPVTKKRGLRYQNGARSTFFGAVAWAVVWACVGLCVRLSVGLCVRIVCGILVCENECGLYEAWRHN
jgi:hypothetical protein